MATHRWLHEPLLHFLLLGAIIFGIDHSLAKRAGDPHTIVIDARVDAEAKRVFEAERGRAPTSVEMQALRRVWLDNEILYREGLALEVDKGDATIRDRVIFKALNTIDAGVKLPPIDARELERWFEAHRAKYDEPARFDFQEAVLSGDRSEAAVRQFVEALEAGAPGDARVGLRVFRGRPASNLEQSYGEEFARQLGTTSAGQWRALKSKDGWRAIQLVKLTPAQPANFEALRGVVLQDWKDATAADQRTAAVRALEKKYRILGPEQS